ncbi:hypothetical protein J1N35_023478 [Gossypium stocksii]|uniref:Uncharacterized protein n=1 Tax=Gossypium stocksii TaxID=47602 RepID=A0A9D3VJW6_9ROSI|nr:hypothetical protein J1N35_023478 [Gossypium stocksii]
MGNINTVDEDLANVNIMDEEEDPMMYPGGFIASVEGSDYHGDGGQVDLVQILQRDLSKTSYGWYAMVL